MTCFYEFLLRFVLNEVLVTFLRRKFEKNLNVNFFFSLLIAMRFPYCLFTLQHGSPLVQSWSAHIVVPSSDSGGRLPRCPLYHCSTDSPCFHSKEGAPNDTFKFHIELKHKSRVVSESCEAEWKVTLPEETRVTLVHRGGVWLRSRVQETSYHCHNLEWSPQQPSVPWRRRSAGKDSCSGVRWTERGYLVSTQPTHICHQTAPLRSYRYNAVLLFKDFFFHCSRLDIANACK